MRFRQNCYNYCSLNSVTSTVGSNWTNAGGVTFSNSGQFAGNCATFNGGATHKLTNPYDASITIAANTRWTGSMRIKASSLATATRVIVGIRSTSALATLNWELRVTTAGAIQFISGRSNGTSANVTGTSGAIVTGTWSHVLWWWDGRALSIRVDGAATQRTAYGSSLYVADTTDITLGQTSFSNPSSDYQGDICEISFFNKLLTASEKAILMRSNSFPTTCVGGARLLGC